MWKSDLNKISLDSYLLVGAIVVDPVNGFVVVVGPVGLDVVVAPKIKKVF